MAEKIQDRDRLAYILFFPYMTLFLLYVGFGYYYGVSAVLPNIMPSTRLLIALGVIVIVYFFARHTGHSLYEARQPGSRDRVTWLALFLILFVFSGCGFLASSMLIFEGPNVIREQTESMIGAWTDMNLIGKKALAVPEVEALERRVDEKQTRLLSEIATPFRKNFCGVGPKARDIITEIAQDIPGFAEISGTGQDHDCRKKEEINSIAQAYKDNIEKSLAALPIMAKSRIPERKRFLDELDIRTTAEIAKLSDLKTSLGGVAVYIGGIAQYQQAVRVLEEAASAYTVFYKNLCDLSGEPRMPGLPATVDITPSERIASIPDMPNNVVHRLDHPTTWIYLFFALTFDFLAAYAASAVVLIHRRSGYLYEQHAAGWHVGGPGSDVLSLWRPRENPISSNR